MARTGGVEYVMPAEWLKDESPQRREDDGEESRPENVHTPFPFLLPHDPEGLLTNAEGPGLCDQNQR